MVTMTNLRFIDPKLVFLIQSIVYNMDFILKMGIQIKGHVCKLKSTPAVILVFYVFVETQTQKSLTVALR